MDFHILKIWISPLSFVGTSGVIFHFNSFFDKIHVSKQNSPRWDASFAASHLGLFCLPMSHKKDARLIWVKHVLNVVKRPISRTTSWAMSGENLVLPYENEHQFKHLPNLTSVFAVSYYRTLKAHSFMKWLFLSVETMAMYTSG